MFGISGEHLLVLLVILLIFGPKRLPDLGHSIGRTMKNFKDAMSGDSDTKPVASAAAPQVERKAETSTTAQPVDAEIVKESQAEKV
ncbi:MAG: twin-arginine translocase TatA/TatE family subunit [Bdellovibrionota bacterium]